MPTSLLTSMVCSKAFTFQLKESLNEEIGKNLLERLKNNQESKVDRKIALSYLNTLLEQTEKEIGNELWEKLEL